MENKFNNPILIELKQRGKDYIGSEVNTETVKLENGNNHTVYSIFNVIDGLFIKMFRNPFAPNVMMLSVHDNKNVNSVDIYEMSTGEGEEFKPIAETSYNAIHNKFQYPNIDEPKDDSNVFGDYDSIDVNGALEHLTEDLPKPAKINQFKAREKINDGKPLGSELKFIRETNGITLEELSERTNYSVEELEAFENMHWDTLPVKTLFTYIGGESKIQSIVCKFKHGYPVLEMHQDYIIHGD